MKIGRGVSKIWLWTDTLTDRLIIILCSPAWDGVTRGSAIAEELRDALVSRNSATT